MRRVDDFGGFAICPRGGRKLPADAHEGGSHLTGSDSDSPEYSRNALQDLDGCGRDPLFDPQVSTAPRAHFARLRCLPLGEIRGGRLPCGSLWELPVVSGSSKAKSTTPNCVVGSRLLRCSSRCIIASTSRRKTAPPFRSWA